jgi:hypothetical protein
LSQRDPPDHFRAFSQQPAAVNDNVTAHDRSDFVTGFAQFRADRIEQCELNLGPFGNDRLAVPLLRESGRADREAEHGKQKNRQAIPLQHLVTSFEKRREPRGRRYVTLCRCRRQENLNRRGPQCLLFDTPLDLIGRLIKQTVFQTTFHIGTR